MTPLTEAEVYEVLLRAAGAWPICRPDDYCPKCAARRAAIERKRADLVEAGLL